MKNAVVKRPPRLIKQNKGSALAISLVILTSVTLGAVYAMQRSGTQLKLVANMQHLQTIDSYAVSNNEGALEYLRGNVDPLANALRAKQRDEFGNPILDANGNEMMNSVEIFPNAQDRLVVPNTLALDDSLVFVRNVLGDGSSIGVSRSFQYEISTTVSQRTGVMSEQIMTGFLYHTFTADN